MKSTPDVHTLVKPNRYYKNTKHIKPQIRSGELNIFGSYVAHEVSTELFEVGVILLFTTATIVETEKVNQNCSITLSC